MQRRPVTSSNVASVGWEPAGEDTDEGTLEVQFRSGHIYHYARVPESIYQALVGAASVGSFLRDEVIGTYDHERIR
jgi:hypothetical protein